jgi:uncharacterized Tic20 family protein
MGGGQVARILSPQRKAPLMETPLPTAIFASSGTDKIWTMLCHFSFFVGLPFLLPFIVYFAMRHDSEYVAANAREALNFHLSVLIYSLCCIPLVFFLVGGVLLVIIGICSLVLAVLAAIDASKGKCYRYPFTLRLV